MNPKYPLYSRPFIQHCLDSYTLTATFQVVPLIEQIVWVVYTLQFLQPGRVAAKYFLRRCSVHYSSG